MFDHLLESSHRDDSNKLSNIGFGQEIKELASIEIHFTHLIWRSDTMILVFQVSPRQHYSNVTFDDVRWLFETVIAKR